MNIIVNDYVFVYEGFIIISFIDSRKLNDSENEEMFQYKTLNDIAACSMLELLSYEKTTSSVGDSIIIQYLDAHKADRRVKGQLLNQMPQVGL